MSDSKWIWVLVLLLALLIAVGIGLFISYREAEYAKDRARMERARAEQAMEETRETYRQLEELKLEAEKSSASDHRESR